jgi:hypothetical protein
VSDQVIYCGLSICAGDVDWIEFSSFYGFTVDLMFWDVYGNLDLEIYSAQTLGFVDGSYSDDDDEYVSRFDLPAGTYWARVFGGSGVENDYCIEVNMY